jgi:hypothetical protein
MDSKAEGCRSSQVIIQVLRSCLRSLAMDSRAEGCKSSQVIIQVLRSCLS